MAIERTLILCKPDAVSRNLVGEIIGRIERRGYIIAAMKLMQLSGDKARAHYAEHEGKPFFAGLVEFITSGPLVALAVEGEGAIEGCRQLIGATNPLAAAPGSIRADFAQNDRAQSRARQRQRRERGTRTRRSSSMPNEFVTRKHDMERWIRE